MEVNPEQLVNIIGKQTIQINFLQNSVNELEMELLKYRQAEASKPKEEDCGCAEKKQNVFEKAINNGHAVEEFMQGKTES